MTFAANAQEEGATRVAMIPSRLEIGKLDRKAKDDHVDAAKDTSSEPRERGLTSEEVFHAVKAAERDGAAVAAKKAPAQKDDVAAAAPKPEDRYRRIVQKYALENGVAIELAHAVITVESNYKVYSLGNAGEVGLMQIKPATARQMGYDGTKTGLFDPETNIKYGMKYLGKAQKLGDGTTCGTILKYNAGHGAKRMNPVSRAYCKKVKRQLASNKTASLEVKTARSSDPGA
ncbi:lytic transglycosylase domain-containing protein [Mesorhizobium marinum]